MFVAISNRFYLAMAVQQAMMATPGLAGGHTFTNLQPAFGLQQPMATPVPQMFTSPTPHHVIYSQGQIPDCQNSPACGANSSHSSTPNIAAMLEDIMNRISRMENKLGLLDSISNQLTYVQEDVAALKTKVGEIEHSTQYVSNRLDDIMREERVKNVQDVDFTVQGLCFEHDKLHESLLDLQCRSMRETLMFYNIPEETGEVPEDVVLRFCENELKIEGATTKILLDRAHRLGRIEKGKIRPLVAKFHYFKQREEVRMSAKNLKDTSFGLGEQFPKEIQDRRKPLVPIWKRAKQQGKKANFVRDKLYIDGRLYSAGDAFYYDRREMSGPGPRHASYIY